VSDHALANPSRIEQVLLAGDLSKLNPDERVSYYLKVCDSLGLNPATKPFEYITLNGKLTLYARKDSRDATHSSRAEAGTQAQRQRSQGRCRTSRASGAGGQDAL
jgi:hypothetical protein